VANLSQVPVHIISDQKLTTLMGIPSKWKEGDGKIYHYREQVDEDEDLSESSYDLAKFGLSESELDPRQSDDRDARINAGQSDNRNARKNAAQAGIQASLLARKNYVAGDSTDNVDAIEEVRGRKKTHINPHAKAVASAITKEMTASSDLYKSQKKRVEKSAQLKADGGVSFKKVKREQPKPKPKPKPLKPKQRSVCSAENYTYRNMCLVSLVLVLLTVAILVPVGVNQDWFTDWFTDSSSSKKVNEEEPTNPGLRPTTSPTTFGPTLSPSAFVVPEEFESLIAATSFDGGASVQAEATPQSEAAKWVASTTSFDTLTEKQKIQRYALAVFYYSTNGGNWTHNERWLSEENECNWYTRSLFVDVCDSNGVITGLELGFNNLGGVIPPEIGLLTSLTRISLGAGLQGNIRGVLPSQLGRLSLMETFNVRDNEISGVIPPELGAWTSLDVLDLSRNKFSGPIPTTIGQMTALTKLDLGRNELTGDVPNGLAAMNLVETVRLEQNNLTGAIPVEVCTLFFRTVPMFYTDCDVPLGVDSEVTCSCCSHCCADEQGCWSNGGVN
jgi:hypothetical protein